MNRFIYNGGFGKRPIGANRYAMNRIKANKKKRLSEKWMAAWREFYSKPQHLHFSEETPKLESIKPFPGKLPDLKDPSLNKKLTEDQISDLEATARKEPFFMPQPGVYHTKDDRLLMDYYDKRTLFPDLHKAWPNISFENFQQFLIDKRK